MSGIIVTKFNNFVISSLKNYEDIGTVWTNADIQKNLKSLLVGLSKDSNRSKKDPDAPKRGKSGYLFFCSANRNKVKEFLGEQAKATDVTKELGIRWNALKASSKAEDKKILVEYENAASLDKTRYQTEKSTYVSSESVQEKSSRRHKKDNGPKRSKSAYLYFCEDFRNQIKDKNPELKSTEITSELGRLWNELKLDKSRVSTLAKYEKLASEDKSRYDSEKNGLLPKEVPKKEVPKKEVPKKEVPKKEVPKKEVPKKEVPKKEVPKKEVPKKEVVVEETEVVVQDKKVNAYQAYCKVSRATVKLANPTFSPQEITKKLGEQWKLLSKDEQQKWAV
jgi:hypothetical protein